MRISGNTILITGGATGTGFALAEAFLQQENKVIICGRREDKLEQEKDRFYQIQTMRCDASDPEDRNRLYHRVVENHKDLNILINNAGIQKEIDFKNGMTDLFGEEKESSCRNFLKTPFYKSNRAPTLPVESISRWDCSDHGITNIKAALTKGQAF